ncbi:MAG TPA: MauE/DoxX family redox-associated membrane protein [Chitinophagaceae bacterium]|nr:MauE/DoxX family redox-associated membrane protein [Chitinophagaceae bacterium]
MTHQYNISGMTCSKCVAKVKSALLTTAHITEAEVQLAAPQATISMDQHISTPELQAAIAKAGNYTITAAGEDAKEADASSWWQTYKPVVLIFAYITGISLIIQAVNGHFDLQQWMQHFMAGFFITFSFFKLLDISAFADSYAMYDIVARRWRGWGILYPFLELALGIAFLIFPNAAGTNIATLLLMGISIIGVLQSVISKRSIQCACLGAVFKLPMSTVTIIEDGLMIFMSAIMLVLMLF